MTHKYIFNEVAFKVDVQKAINCHGFDTLCNIPDFILADYVAEMLRTLARAHNRTRTWGKVPEIEPVVPEGRER